MANEWSEKTLDQLGPIVTGKTPPSSLDRCFGGDIPFVTPTDMEGHRNIDKTSRFLSTLGFQAVRNSLIPRGAVMVSCIGSDMGKVAIAGKDCVTNQQINSIIVESGDDPLFIYYNLSLRKAELRLIASGSAQPILNKTSFGRVELSLPRPTEQATIARLLGAFDDKIELNRKLNETLEVMVRGLFKSWFVDFEPVRAKTEGCDTGLPDSIAALFPDSLDESEFGDKPTGWKAGKFEDVARSVRSTIPADQIPPDTPYIALEHMPKRSIALSDWGKSDGVASAKAAFSTRNILFGKLRPYFHKVGIAPVNGVCSTDIVVIAPKTSDWLGFALQHASSDAFVEYTYAGSTGTKMPRTSWPEMARYPIAIPPLAIVREFNRVATSLYDRIIATIHQNRSLSSIRDALLPKLISGEIRLKANNMEASE